MAQVKPPEHKIEDPIDTSEHKRMTQTPSSPPESDPQLELPVDAPVASDYHDEAVEASFDGDTVSAAFDDDATYEKPSQGAPNDMLSRSLDDLMGDAPVCDQCGHITVRNGSCYRCLNCGNSLGCS